MRWLCQISHHGHFLMFCPEFSQCRGGEFNQLLQGCIDFPADSITWLDLEIYGSENGLAGRQCFFN